MSVLSRDRMTEEIERWIDAHPGGASTDTSELEDLLRTALELDYTSASCRGGVETGNHYQSVRVGDTVTAGFRSDRAEILDQIDFRGKSVLDLGSNLGELSRSARARGAARVVGVEYDPFFVAVARGLNLANSVDGVEFRQGDIGDADLYGEHFDIVLAFSVFEYVGAVIETVCEVADELLVVETHKLDGNLTSDYVGPVTRRLPAFKLLGRSDWGSTFDEPGERAVLAFARDQETLAAGVIGEGHPRERHLERDRVDVFATSRALQEQFFALFDFGSLDELLQAVRTTSVNLAAMASNRALEMGYRGWLYWFMYLKGYLDYRERKAVGADNAFCAYFTDYHLPRVEEPGVAPGDAHAIALRRFKDLDAIAERGGDELPPLRITVSDPLPRHSLPITLASGRSLRAALLDGWHRVFGAAVCGVDALAAELVYEQYAPVEGRIESYDASEAGRLRLTGWCLSRAEPWDFVELRADGHALGRAEPLERGDVATGLPEVAHANASGFSFDCTAAPPEYSTVDLLPMRDWLPIGRMRLYRALKANPDEETLALATAVGTALETVKPLLGADGDVLALGPVAGDVAGRLLAPDPVTVVNGDPARWSAASGAARMIVGADALAAVAEEDRYGWLDRAAGALRSGGLLLLLDRAWLRSPYPPQLRQLVRLPPEPVRASETVVLLRK